MTVGIGKLGVRERLALRSSEGLPDFTDPLVRLDARTSLHCRLYGGERLKEGYGRIRYRGKKVSAHRAAYEEEHGPIPDSVRLDHLCRNPPCWEVSHLEPVSHAENVSRGASGVWGAQCRKGHPFNAVNTYIHGGHQYCRTCRATSAKNHRLRRAAIKKEGS